MKRTRENLPKLGKQETFLTSWLNVKKKKEDANENATIMSSGTGSQNENLCSIGNEEFGTKKAVTDDQFSETQEEFSWSPSEEIRSIPSSSKQSDEKGSNSESKDFHDDNDIGIFIGKKPSDRKLAQLLENPWQPPLGYKFPFSTHTKGGSIERRYVNTGHLQRYKDWLVLSDSHQGLYCKFCPFFTTGLCGGYNKGMQLRSLVTEPLKKFAKLLGKDGDLECHARSHYHMEAVARAADFLIAFREPKKSVENQLDTYRLQRAKENKERLQASLKNVIFLGRQNIAFRGHREDGLIFDEKNTNKGNFKELMKFRVEECGDVKLKKFLETAGGRNSFVSKTVQNDLIQCCGEEILRNIVEKVKESEYYSLGFDETTDISHKSQMSIFLRYVHGGAIREDFIGFINPRDFDSSLMSDTNRESKTAQSEDAHKRKKMNLSSDDDISEDEENSCICLTGVTLGNTVLKTIQNIGLNPLHCVGIATDGCSVMTSDIVGAVSTIQKVCVNAERCPCYNHALNLSISKSSSVQMIRNALGVVKEVVNFFTSSPKRNFALETHLGRQLISLCETRWVERHDSLILFLTYLEKIATCLEAVSVWRSSSGDNTPVVAKTLLCSITNGEFILSLVCLSDILCLTLPLSRLLQKEDLTKDVASETLMDVMSILEEKRSNVEQVFSQLLEKSTKIATDVGSELKIPRLAATQRNRPNAGGATSLETYYRVNLYIPLLESIHSDLKNRLSENALNMYKLNTLIPNQAVEASGTRLDEDVNTIADKYWRILGEDRDIVLSALQMEIKLWVKKWTRQRSEGNIIPTTAIDAVLYSLREVFPNIRKLLLILCSLPVSTSSAERSFSTLKSIKTYIRSRIGQKRLSGLALMYIHRDVDIEKEKVIERYIEKGGSRRKSLFS